MKSFKHILTEANLSGQRSTGENAWDSYIGDEPDWKNLKLGVDKDSVLRDGAGEMIRKVKKGEPLKLLSNAKSQSGRSFIAHVQLGSDIGYLPISAISKPIIAHKIKNKGDVSEGLLAAALAARFNLPDKTIVQKDIDSVLKKLQMSGGNQYTFSVSNPQDSTKDKVSLLIVLGGPAMADLMDTEKRPLLKSEIKSVLSYVNSKSVIRYARMVNLNNKEDSVNIVSDGLSDNTGTKVDLFVTINGKLTNLNISLKSGGTKQMGQFGGYSAETQENLWKTVGVDISKIRNKFDSNDPDKWLGSVYKFAADEINKHLGSDSKEYNFLKQLSDGIKYAATLGDDSVALLHLSGGSFKVLKFKRLEQKLKEISLEAVYNKKTTPEVYIQDAKTKKKLIGIRVKRERSPSAPNGFYYRNYIEKHSLLVDITQVKN